MAVCDYGRQVVNGCLNFTNRFEPSSQSICYGSPVNNNLDGFQKKMMYLSLFANKHKVTVAILFQAFFMVACSLREMKGMTTD